VLKHSPAFPSIGSESLDERDKLYDARFVR
jgi:hypothetical protein